MNAKVLLAVFKRNFVSYFANPIGYVFICVFVLLSSVAAFMPAEFFNTNLANLDQLNTWLPLIMLVFIPAITMSIWADERRRGTDELLLTIPASDSNIVLGKYFAAVAIYSVSLLFSFLCNWIVLAFLGSPDLGLFISTYFGYWLIGLMMLAIGMVASFLSKDLTIAYVLGALFNTPLVVWVWAGSLSLPSQLLAGKFENLGEALEKFSIGGQFESFGRGILSFSHTIYFVAIAAVMLYVSMILIGRRHWHTNQKLAVSLHYTARVISLLVVAISVTMITQRINLRKDVTDEQLSSLSPKTIELIEGLTPDQPILIEAFISPKVPKEYIETQRNLLTILHELDTRGGNKVSLRINRPEQFSKEADRAQERYGIRPRPVVSLSGGSATQENIFLGVAFKRGLDKIILPFIDQGIPVEYELSRSITTVSQQKRKRIGILKTDAPLYGEMDMQAMMAGRPSPGNWPIVDELEKQYEVVQVDPASPIDTNLDALLAVQPSSLGPPEMENFLTAVQSGLPVAIFEDPFPVFAGGVPATMAPRAAPGGQMAMFQQQQPPPPKGDIKPLWDLLGVRFGGDEVVWQNYNPYPSLKHLTSTQPEFVFIGNAPSDSDTATDAINPDDPISSKLQMLLFPFAGTISALNASDMTFTPLAQTTQPGGTVAYREILRMSMFGSPAGLNPDRTRVQHRNVSQVLAAHITGTLPGQPVVTPEGEEDSAPKSTGPKKLNVVLVADLDMLTEPFFALRAQGAGPNIDLDFDNVTFVLNALDTVAGDDRFLDIRKRRPVHRTLTRVDDVTRAAREETEKAIEDRRKEHTTILEEDQAAMDLELENLQQRAQQGGLDMAEIARRISIQTQTNSKRRQAREAELQQKLQKDVHDIESTLINQRRQVESRYKLCAVVLPPILPLALAVVVLLIRRRRERQGVAKTRLRS